MALERKSSAICKVVIWHLLKCIFAFYSGSFMAASVSYGAFQATEFDALAPFNFQQWIDLSVCCDFSVESKINLIALVTGYCSVLPVLIFSVRRAHWLFLLLLTILHITVSCIALQSFPLLYSYWICVGLLAFVCLASADIVVFFVDESTSNQADKN